MLLKVALKNLQRNPRRTLVTCFMVALGSFNQLLFNGFNTGLLELYRNSAIHARFGNGQVNTKGYREQVYQKPWDHWMSNGDQVRAEIEKIPNVTHVFPRVEFFALLTNGQISVNGRGGGIEAEREAEFFYALSAQEGKVLTTEEDGIFLGAGIARALAVKPGDRVTVLGNTIYGSINGLDLFVTGIFETGKKEVDDSLFRIQLKKAQLLLDSNKVESIAIGTRENDDWPKVEAAIVAKFPELEATAFNVLDKVYYQNSVDFLNRQFKIIRAILLLMIVLMIGNTVSFSILERTQEIGNLRANGESSFEVIKLICLEGFWMGIIGATAGLAIGFLVDATFLKDGIFMPPAPGITKSFYVKLVFEQDKVVWSFVLGALTSVAGTLAAGIKVGRMTIGRALRTA